MSYKDKVRNSINSQRELKSRLWEIVTRHSSAYQRVLALSDADLPLLEEVQGRAGMMPTLQDHARHSFLKVKLGGAEYALLVKHVCGIPYGATWQNVIMAFSTTHLGYHEEVGGGTTHLTVLREEQHKKLCLVLSN